MSKRKKVITTKNKTEVRDFEIDKQICLLSDKLSKQGVQGNALIVAVARIYSNSVLMSYIEHQKNV